MTNSPFDVFAFIPARSGSKSIPLKNLQKIGDVSLVRRAISLALTSLPASHIVLSSDSDLILNESQGHSINLHKRPDSVSSDTTTTCDTLIEFLHSNPHFTRFKWIVLIEPTSVFCSKEDLCKCIQLLSSTRDSNVYSVAKVHHTFHYANQRILEDGLLSFWNNDLRSATSISQRKTGSYRFGNICSIRLDALLSGNGFFEPTSSFFIVPFLRSINIDSLEELQLARLLFHANPSLYSI